ncbi:unnamed protein product [Ectocarpus sp. 13 AM-2016]
MMWVSCAATTPIPSEVNRCIVCGCATCMATSYSNTHYDVLVTHGKFSFLDSCPLRRIFRVDFKALPQTCFLFERGVRDENGEGHTPHEPYKPLDDSRVPEFTSNLASPERVFCPREPSEQFDHNFLQILDWDVLGR